MFMRGCMKNDIGTKIGKDSVQTIPVTYISDHALDSQSWKMTIQLSSNRENAVLSMTQQNQTRRIVRRDLSTKFRANRAAGSGYDYSLFENPLPQAIAIGVDWFVAK